MAWQQRVTATEAMGWRGRSAAQGLVWTKGTGGNEAAWFWGSQIHYLSFTHLRMFRMTANRARTTKTLMHSIKRPRNK